jgi:hypothetical protein
MRRLSGAIALPLTWVAMYQYIRTTISAGVLIIGKGTYPGFATLSACQLSLFVVLPGVFSDLYRRVQEGHRSWT